MRILLIASALALPLAGCGAGSTTSTTNAASARAQNPAAAAFTYARCMREHGVPNFPDPRVHVSGAQTSIAMIVPGSMGASPAFKSAEKACRGVLPGPKDLSPAEQHARALNLLAFARCMRTHGASRFPDPTPTGQITREMLAAAHVDLRLHSVQTAAYACVPSAGGAITAAQIQAAIAHGR
jgi:hypothetical protein